MRLSLKSDSKKLQNKLFEYERDEQISNIEVLEMTQLADESMDKVEAKYLTESKDIIQKSVDDISQALQKMAIAIEKNKPSQEDSDNLNEAIQFQLAQLIVNYNRTVGKVKFKTGFLKYFKKDS
ncbi:MULTISPECIES: hypothetical protein [Candidatus Williamhamiltonella]|uniref:Uncharacterized protein n=1 Tax=Candidatus Williamhamiltonella defendens TaxID=138072 RepID=A0A2D3TFE7_9ENTR|nr:hypothetical protein [Candidatus Hamiltonella defensa]ATW34519.1 hypothetical protein BJP43_09905 [Candidatus Hamiltonella defensa]